MLAASKKLPDIYFSWAGDFANKFVRAGLAADLSDVIAPAPSGGRPSPRPPWRRSRPRAATTVCRSTSTPSTSPTTRQLFDEVGATAPTTLRGAHRHLRQAQGRGLHADRLRQPVRLARDPLHHAAQRLQRPGRRPERRTTTRPAVSSPTPATRQALTEFSEITDACFAGGDQRSVPRGRPGRVPRQQPAMHYLESLEFAVLTKDGGAPAELADNWSFFRLPVLRPPQGRHELRSRVLPTGSWSTPRASRQPWRWTS